MIQSVPDLWNPVNRRLLRLSAREMLFWNVFWEIKAFLLSQFVMFYIFLYQDTLQFAAASFRQKDIQSLEKGTTFQLIQGKKLCLKLFLMEICLKFLPFHNWPILHIISGIRLSDPWHLPWWKRHSSCIRMQISQHNHRTSFAHPVLKAKWLGFLNHLHQGKIEIR